MKSITENVVALKERKQASENEKELRQQRKQLEQFMDILGRGDIKTVFQPIVSLKDGSVLGYEALSRGPKDSMLESPAKLFDIARIHGKLWELEFLCRIKALENAAKSGVAACLFLNVDPSTINDEKFKKGFTRDFLAKYDISPQSIIFEITEKNAVSDYQSFRKTIDNYKGQGYKIAIDDTGSGYSGLTMIAEIHPHYIKLDMNLIRNIDKNGLKSALIKTFYDFCQITDIKLVAEGIETVSEMNALIDIGIDYGQGYLIQKPSGAPQPISPEIIEQIKKRNQTKRLLYFSRASEITVGDICTYADCVGSNVPSSQVLDLFSNDGSLHALPVADDGKVLGLVMKESFFSKLGTKYGFALYLNRPVAKVMDNQPLIVDAEASIDTVSRSAMTRGEDHLYDSIIVTRHGVYCGVLTVKDLLDKTTELEVNHAKHLNPLTGMPGNMLIEIKLSEYVQGDKPYTVLYIDIDNFKVYNDVYGFESGDSVLLSLANIIRSCAERHDDSTFAGHIGGDDYVLVIDGYDAFALARDIIEAFSKKQSQFYSREDLDKGYVMVKNRYGKEEKFGHMTLSIAGVTNRNRRFNDVFTLSEQATKMKKCCKEVWDNHICIDGGCHDESEEEAAEA